MTVSPPLVHALGLPALWQGRGRFTVLLDRFDGGEAFAALWAAWRDDPARCERLQVLALADGPLPPHTLHAACARQGLPGDDLPPALPGTPDFHTVVVAGGRVRLLLAAGEARRAWRELVASVDAFVLDAPSPDPVGLPKALVRLAAPDATVSAPLADDTFRAALRARGFVLEADTTSPVTARYRPAFTPSRAPVRRVAAAATERHALIVGAGLAGAATAAALARQGWSSTVLDRHPAPAREASGNPAGLFHGIVNPDDGPHARFNRAAAFEALRAVTAAMRNGHATGSTAGLLRLEAATTAVAAMRAQLARLGLTPDYVQALDAHEAAAACGIPLGQPAWFYPGGGWVQPAGLVRSLLAEAGGACAFRGGVDVHRVDRVDGRWQALAASGEVIAESAVLVVAGANDTLRLLGHPAWPLQAVRGQITTAPAVRVGPLPALPLAGGGYVMPEVAGLAVFGATAQADDPDPAVRAADHGHNLAQLARLLGRDVGEIEGTLAGRTAWRCVSEDRLPLIGEVPDVGATAVSAEQVRFVPRREGLFVFTGLGSRGITWCTLGGEVLAATIAGAPSPLPSSLLDAVDPARFFTRAARRGGPGAVPGDQPAG